MLDLFCYYCRERTFYTRVEGTSRIVGMLESVGISYDSADWGSNFFSQRLLLVGMFYVGTLYDDFEQVV